MPNWITNKVTAPKHVIKAVLNAEGHIDFNLMAPFPGPRGQDWNGIFCDTVVFADEDIGSNCGAFTLKAGVTTASDIAPNWNVMTDEQRAKWKSFAYHVKGYFD
jgi:hypothetical protein